MEKEIDLTDLEARIERMKQTPEFQQMLDFSERITKAMSEFAASIVKSFSTPKWQELYLALAELEREPGIGSDSVMAMGMDDAE